MPLALWTMREERPSPSATATVPNNLIRRVTPTLITHLPIFLHLTANPNGQQYLTLFHD
jgi:hypothetical protein